MREVADADLWSTRRQTNTETDITEPYSRELHDEDRQSTRRQQTIDSKNDEMDSQDLSNDKDFDLPNYGGNDAIVPDTFDKKSDDMVEENESFRGGKYNYLPNPTPNHTKEYRY